MFEEYINRILEAPLPTSYPYISEAAPGELLSLRCGPGCQNVEDLKYLFLETIHSPLQNYQRGGEEISSFCVKRSRHISFFGLLTQTSAHPDTPPNAPSAPTSVPLATPTPENQHPADISDGASYDQASHHDDGPHRPIVNQVVPYTEQVEFKWAGSSFAERVPYEKQAVSDKADKLAALNLSLWIDNCGFVVWDDCFEKLESTGGRTVIIHGNLSPVMGKRQGEVRALPAQSRRPMQVDTAQPTEEEDQLLGAENLHGRHYEQHKETDGPAI